MILRESGCSDLHDWRQINKEIRRKEKAELGFMVSG
jgi:hypothetical protein